jgi:hypothetical protein
MNASIGFHEANQNGWVRLVKFAYGSIFSYSIMLSCKLIYTLRVISIEPNSRSLNHTRTKVKTETAKQQIIPTTDKSSS